VLAQRVGDDGGSSFVRVLIFVFGSARTASARWSR
jgi:hypothetical protein